MKNALLIHGWTRESEYYNPDRPTPSNDHWLPWLSKQLILRDIPTVAIEMPRSYYPEYEVWKRELERYDINEHTILVGHSCGGGFLIRWLSETDVKVGRVVLVAPWLGYGAAEAGPFDETFFDFTLDPEISGKTAGLTIMHSTNDMDEVQQSVARLRQELTDFEYVELENKGHFTKRALGGEAFEELLGVLL